MVFGYFFLNCVVLLYQQFEWLVFFDKVDKLTLLEVKFSTEVTEVTEFREASAEADVQCPTD